MDVFRIHPAVGVARVGNSQKYVIAPESMDGRPVSEGSSITGGLPIRAGTESDIGATARPSVRSRPIIDT